MYVDIAALRRARRDLLDDEEENCSYNKYHDVCIHFELPYYFGKLLRL